jgi:pyruvate/2-oxoglutarate dehydrogenase complex dihydrolipoamide dehydrogenase (E3) component
MFTFGGFIMHGQESTYEKLPEYPQSYWRDKVNLPRFPRLSTDTRVVIVGGGITGITSAFLLSNQGLKVAVLEAGKYLKKKQRLMKK